MQNNEQVSALTLPHAGNLRSGINAALYPMTENTGSVISDRLGLNPDVTMSGTASNPLSTEAYWWAPDQDDSYFDLPDSLFPTLVDGCAQLFAFEYFRQQDSTEWETILSFGQAAIAYGMLQVSIVPNGKIDVTTRGKSATANTAIQFDAADFDMSTYNGEEDGVRIALLLHGVSFPDISFSVYVNGTWAGTIAHDLSADDGDAWPVSTGQLRIGARAGGNFGIGNSGGEARMRNFLSYRQDSYNAQEAADIIESHARVPGEIPRALLR